MRFLLISALLLAGTVVLPLEQSFAAPYSYNNQQLTKTSPNPSGTPYPALDQLGSQQTELQRPGRFILIQLYDDLRFITSDPDFYLVVGGIGASPFIFEQVLSREAPSVTEKWGKSLFADSFFEAGELIGNGTIPVALGVSSWGFGKVAGSRKLQQFGTDMLRTQAINGLLTAALKGGVNRTRPDGAAYSYPSGHTSSSFAAAGVVYRHLGPGWGIGAFVIAGYVGLSRLQEGKHYFSDIVAGGILGSYVSLKLSDRKRQRGPVNLRPTMVKGGPGLKLSIRF